MTALRFRWTALVAAASLLLTGCQATANSQPAPTSITVVNDGDRLTGVSVTGAVGHSPTLKVTDGEKATEPGSDIQRHVLVKTDGAVLTENDTVLLVLASYHSVDGTPISEYGSLGPATQLTNEQLPAFVKPLVTGLRDGERVLASVPIQYVADADSVGDHILIVADIVKVTPGASATGTPTNETADFPWATVSATEGEPTVTVSSTVAAPTEQHTAVVMRGSGKTVAAGDTVVVQYTGLLFADGTVFDTSWKTGLPPAFPTDMVVPGFRNALVGQQVGSRVVTVFPPDLGYGSEDYPPIPGGSTLIFVADIIGIVG